MELLTDVTLKLGHEELCALTHLLGSLSTHTQRELGLNDDEITIVNDMYELLAVTYDFDEDQWHIGM